MFHKALGRREFWCLAHTADPWVVLGLVCHVLLIVASAAAKGPMAVLAPACRSTPLLSWYAARMFWLQAAICMQIAAGLAPGIDWPCQGMHVVSNRQAQLLMQAHMVGHSCPEPQAASSADINELPVLSDCPAWLHVGAGAASAQTGLMSACTS